MTINGKHITKLTYNELADLQKIVRSVMHSKEQTHLEKENEELKKEIESLKYKNPKCKKCKTPAIRSKGFSNAYGMPDLVGKRTIYQGKGPLVHCWKCPECGRSWV